MRYILPLMLLVGCILSARGETPKEQLARKEAETTDHRIYVVHVYKDSIIHGILRKDRPQNVKDAALPHFVIRTADNKFILTIGGEIQPIFGWDLGNDLYEQPDAGGGSVTSQIPVPAPQFKKSDFYINALNGNISLQVVGFGGTADQITGYIKIGTDGWHNPLNLKNAYVMWRGIKMGMSPTLLKDELACQPPMIDPQGPCGVVSTTNYLINYTTRSLKGFRAAIGVEVPTFNSSNGRYLGRDYKAFNGKDILNKPVCDPTAYNQLVPDIPIWVEWAKDNANRVRLSGLLRTLNYRDLIENCHRTTVGWGVMLSGNISPIPELAFCAQAIYGKGIGNYIQDMAGVSLSFTPKTDEPGILTPTPQMGLVFGVTYNIAKRWQMNAVYSMSRMWNVDTYAFAESFTDGNTGNFNNYRYCNYVGANVLYNISSFFQVGLEYIYGQRKTYYKGQAHNNRISAAVSVTL